MDGSDVLEELLGGDEVRQAGEELCHVDEVHAGQDILVEPQQAQRCAEEELLAVSAEHVPHAARQVQWKRLAIECEDPTGEQFVIQEGISTKTQNEATAQKVGYYRHFNLLNYKIKCVKLSYIISVLILMILACTVTRNYCNILNLRS